MRIHIIVLNIVVMIIKLLVSKNISSCCFVFYWLVLSKLHIASLNLQISSHLSWEESCNSLNCIQILFPVDSFFEVNTGICANHWDLGIYQMITVSDSVDAHTVWTQNALFSVRILKTLCRKLKLPEDFDYQQLARLTPGYVGADLMALCREAAMSAVNRVLLEIRGQPQIQSQNSTKELLTSRVQTEAAATDGEVREQQTTDPVPEEESEQNDLQVWGAPKIHLTNSTEYNTVQMRSCSVIT